MQIPSEKNPYEGMNLGQFAAEREKILKEAAPDLTKIDSFSQEQGEETAEVNLFGRKHPGLSEKLLDTTGLNAASETNPVSSLTLKNYMNPANEGKIAHMALTYGQLGDARDNYLDALKTFFREMPEAKFDILASSKYDVQDLQSYVKELADRGEIMNPDRIKITATGVHLSIWAQDSTLVAGNELIEQDRAWFPGSGDGAVASELAKLNPDMQYRKLEGIFVDGGNQLATREKLFVGSDAIAFMMKDMRNYPAKYETVKANLGIETTQGMSQEELCKLMIDRTFPHQKVVIVGYKGKQPAFHIDMAMTPLGKPDPDTGKPVIMVGDPSMAVKILKDVKKRNPDKFARYEAAVNQKVRWSPAHPLDRMMEEVGGDKALQENFDALAKGFERDGYKIERVPYLGSSSLRNHPWLSYNNAIFDGDKVFIPNFGIEELDNKANETLKKYGHTPVPIDMNAISSLQGAINCITKVIERVYT